MKRRKVTVGMIPKRQKAESSLLLQILPILWQQGKDTVREILPLLAANAACHEAMCALLSITQTNDKHVLLAWQLYPSIGSKEAFVEHCFKRKAFGALSVVTQYTEVSVSEDWAMDVAILYDVPASVLHCLHLTNTISKEWFKLKWRKFPVAALQSLMDDERFTLKVQTRAEWVCKAARTLPELIRLVSIVRPRWSMEFSGRVAELIGRTPGTT
jgi:hypothetical protein